MYVFLFLFLFSFLILFLFLFCFLILFLFSIHSIFLQISDSIFDSTKMDATILLKFIGLNYLCKSLLGENSLDFNLFFTLHLKPAVQVNRKNYESSTAIGNSLC